MFRAEDLHLIVLSRAVTPLHGIGGLERHVHDLVRHLLMRGVRVTLITRPPHSGQVPAPVHQRLDFRIVPYRTFPFAGRQGTTAIDRSTAYPVFGWRAGHLAAKLVRGGGIHLVHGMGAASLGYAWARRRDWFGTVPFVFNPHGMEEFGSTGPDLRILKRTVYAPLRKAVRACAQAADRIVATDRGLVPVVLKHLRVSDSRVRVVPNAVDLEEIDRLTAPADAQRVRARLGLSSDDVLLLSVGRLEENKGFQHLVAALAQLVRERSIARPTLGGQWRCAVLGEGPYRSRLQQAAASAGLCGPVILPGRVTGADLHAWYEAATLFVHPSLYEGSSIVTLEAMAHGKAVVATTAGGLPDKVRAGFNGWLVEPGRPELLAQALDDALSQRERLSAMGKNSRTIVEREFSWAEVVGCQLGVYEELLSSARAAP